MKGLPMTVAGFVLPAILLWISLPLSVAVIILFSVMVRLAEVHEWRRSAVPTKGAKDVTGERQRIYQDLLDEYGGPTGNLRKTLLPDTEYGMVNSCWVGNDLYVTPHGLLLPEEQFRALVISEIMERKHYLRPRGFVLLGVTDMVLVAVQVAGTVLLGGDVSIAQALVLSVVGVITGTILRNVLKRRYEAFHETLNEVIFVECGESYLHYLEMRRDSVDEEGLAGRQHKIQTENIKKLRKLLPVHSD